MGNVLQACTMHLQSPTKILHGSQVRRRLVPGPADHSLIAGITILILCLNLAVLNRSLVISAAVISYEFRQVALTQTAVRYPEQTPRAPLSILWSWNLVTILRPGLEIQMAQAVTNPGSCNSILHPSSWKHWTTSHVNRAMCRCSHLLQNHPRR